MDDIIVSNLTTLIGVVLGVILGVFAGPWAEKRLRRSEGEEAIRNFYIELQDLTVLLKNPIAQAYDNFSSVRNMNGGPCKIYVFEPIEIITLDRLTSHPLDVLSYGERNGLRKMRRIIRNINDAINKQDEYDSAPNYWRTVSRLLADLYSLIELMLKDKHNYKHSDNTNTDSIVHDVLNKIINNNKKYIDEIAHNKAIPADAKKRG